MGGIYSLISAGSAYEKKLEVTSNNLANVNTAGFKEDQPVFKEILSEATRVVPESDEEQFLSHEYLDLYVGMDRSAVKVDAVVNNFEQGRMESTGNPLDLAIQSDGFFTVSTPQGERYTRSGQFVVNSEKILTTKDGFPVLGQNGAIKIEGDNVAINDQGGINVDGQLVEQLKLTKFRNPHNLQKLGASMYAPLGSDNVPITDGSVRVRQGMLESSNVNSVKEMVTMIQGNRAYEQIQTAMKNIDRLDEKAISISRIS